MPSSCSPVLTTDSDIVLSTSSKSRRSVVTQQRLCVGANGASCSKLLFAATERIGRCTFLSVVYLVFARERFNLQYFIFFQIVLSSFYVLILLCYSDYSSLNGCKALGFEAAFAAQLSILIGYVFICIELVVKCIGDWCCSTVSYRSANVVSAVRVWCASALCWCW